MHEVILDLQEFIDRNGEKYLPRVCGREVKGLWEGWLEFIPESGGPVIQTPRETTQPNRVDLEYWATGLEPVYLEGALLRAMRRLMAG